MIDTGSMKSIINENIAHKFYSTCIENETFQIKSVHKTSLHNEVAKIPLPTIFNTGNTKYKFYVFNINKNYQGLIGTDLLNQLGARVDFKNKKLVTNNAISNTFVFTVWK